LLDRVGYGGVGEEGEGWRKKEEKRGGEKEVSRTE
jgi:hypothetical protein